MHDIQAWQKDYYRQPMVFEVWIKDESTGNFYDTKSGADIEVSWRKQRGEKARVICHYLHNEDLSRRRWLG